MNRRRFLGALAGAGAAALGAEPLLRAGNAGAATPRPAKRPHGSILHHSPTLCPIDTVVIVMMENRSFDHYLGWLADDEAYLEAGRRRYGNGFSINGSTHQTYVDASGAKVQTRAAGAYEQEKLETRGCTLRIPGHSWDRSRIARDHGFLAAGTGNDEFAITHYTAAELPIYAEMARRFTVFDHWHSSLLGPTFPNRQYLLSAQSEGMKINPGLRQNPRPLEPGIFRAETILERLTGAGVSAGYYHTNVPLLALWGPDRMAPYIRSLDRYFDDAANGQLPSVSFVEPQFGGGDALRTDDHPRGDVGLGQRWVREVLRAFTHSPQWRSGAFVLTYDEGGGFFDHVAPPLLADSRASKRDKDNFGQAGFRVPTFLASPFAAVGAVDSRRYDHTSILRFLEWRFLGAPPEGATGGASWALTLRDRDALNMGATLRPDQPDPDLGFDLDTRIPQPAPPCTPAQAAARAPDVEADPFDNPDLTDLSETRFPAATYKPWLADVTTVLQ